MTRVIIAGAGIGGLSAALALAEQGVDVEVFERASVFQSVGAGLQLAPNATRVLARLGILDAVAATAVAPEAVRIRRGRDGRELVSVPLGPRAVERFGAPYLVAHRGDVHAALLAKVRTVPRITVSTGQAVERHETAGTGVRVIIGSDGGVRTMEADGLVGADGIRSGLRAARRLGIGDDPVYSGRTAWRTMIPVERVPEFARQPITNLWLGRKLHLVHYPVRSGTLVNVVGIVEDVWRGEAEHDFWAVRGDVLFLRQRFSPWIEDARELVETAAEWRVWPLFDRTALQPWSIGPVTLLGDAAHPTMPFLAQGAAQAIEDAGALGEAVRRSGPDLVTAFAAYEAARRPKATRVQRDSRRQGAIYHLDQPAATLRDVMLRTLGPSRMLSRYDWLYGTTTQG